MGEDFAPRRNQARLALLRAHKRRDELAVGRWARRIPGAATILDKESSDIWSENFRTSLRVKMIELARKKAIDELHDMQRSEEENKSAPGSDERDDSQEERRRARQRMMGHAQAFSCPGEVGHLTAIRSASDEIIIDRSDMSTTLRQHWREAVSF